MLLLLKGPVQRKSGSAKVLTQGMRMITAADALLGLETRFSMFCFPCTYRGGKHIHASHAQNRHDRNLIMSRHMQLSHEEDRQNPHREITQRRKRTVHVRHGDDDFDIHTRAVDVRIKGPAGPEVGERLALQQHQEHEHDTSHHGEGHDGVQDPDVDAPDGDAHQKDAYGDLAGDGGEAVGDFAEPPVLYQLSL